MSDKKIMPSQSEKFLSELVEQISDLNNKRILQAFLDSDPVQSMEKELGKILVEVLKNEN